MSTTQITRARVKYEHPELVEMTGSTPSLPIHASPSRAISISSIVSSAQEATTHSTMEAPSTQASTPSTTSSGIQAIKNQSRELIQAIQKLSALNIDATLPSLPKFVVVGDQSAGKSSIIEAVCDITLPRSEGTCTRCPFQITTTRSKNENNWTCKVNLIKKFVYDGRSRSGKNEGYDQWIKSEQTIAHFATVTDKSSLENILRRAQLATLNPKMQPEEFMNDQVDFTQKPQCQFSPNIVSLEITGPDLPELSLYDLPGAINRHEDNEMQFLVDFIKKLTLKYLKDEKTLVLLAVAANTDVENSTAFRYVGEAKAIDRCMGVLTKPDLMDRTRFAAMRKILNGESFKVGGAPNSWFVTKQLSQDELNDGVTHAEARRREQQFFNEWTRMDDFADRFGVPALQNAISRKYTKHIINELPEIVARVESRLKVVQEELTEFPQRPASAAHKVIDEIYRLTFQVATHIKGEELVNDFRTKYRATIKECQKLLQSSRPEIILQTPGYQKPVLSVDLESDMDVDDESPSKRAKSSNGRSQPITPQHRTQTATPGPLRNSNPRKRDRTNGSPVSYSKVFVLDEVQAAFERGTTGGLPGEVNSKVRDQLVLESIEGWHTIISNLAKDVKKLVKEMLMNTMDATINTWKQTQLYPETQQVLTTFFDNLMAEQSNIVHHLVKCETYKPIMYNQNLSQVVKGHEAKLLADRLKIRVDELLDTLEADGIKVPRGAERAKKLSDANWLRENKLNLDEYQREVGQLAIPLAYYEIASARLLDTVANHFEYGIMRTLREDLKQALREGLKVMDEEHCMQLLAEDPEREVERIRLLREQEKLVQALDELKGLPLRE